MCENYIVITAHVFNEVAHAQASSARGDRLHHYCVKEEMVEYSDHLTVITKALTISYCHMANGRSLISILNVRFEG